MSDSALFIVEDEMIVARDIKETLLKLGYTVSGIARTGEAAVEKVAGLKPDLVLMDIHLGGKMDGIEAAEKIGLLYDIPVIYLTAYADPGLLERAKITGPYGYILKPYDERELHSVIDIALYKHRIDRNIKKRDTILFAVSSAVEWLLRISSPESCPTDLLSCPDESGVRNVLEHVGIAIDASSITIFQLVSDAGGQATMSLRYEWSGPGVASAINKPELKAIHLNSPVFSQWHAALLCGEVLSVTKKSVDESGQWFFGILSIGSIVMVPIFIRDTLWGMIGFSSATERSWSADEIEALRITANLLGAAMGYR
jgi:two-component system, response regulator PdtaR